MASGKTSVIVNRDEKAKKSLHVPRGAALRLRHSAAALRLRHSAAALRLRHSATALRLRHSATALRLRHSAERHFVRAEKCQ